jgi:hypothetical protein
MAPQKGNPAPLIIFVVLFVFSTVGLVLVAMELSKARDLMDAGFDASAPTAGRYTRKSPEGEGLKQRLKTTAEELHAAREALDLYEEVTGWTGSPEKLREKLVEDLEGIEKDTKPSLLAYVKLKDREFMTLQRRLETERDQHAQRVKGLKEQIERAEAEVKSKEKIIAQKNKEIEDAHAQATRERNRLKQVSDGLRSTLETERREHKKTVGDLEAEIARLKRRLAVVEDKLRKVLDERRLTGRTTEAGTPQFEPADGEVILVDRDAGVVIDIGKKDGVRRGLRFEIYSEKADGTRVKRGDIEIKTVLPAISRGLLLSGENPLDVVHKGDIIVNPAFNPGRAQVFVADASFDEAKKRAFRETLKKYGSVLEDKVTVRTDYLIIGGQRQKDDEQVQKAEKWGIPVIKASDLNALLGR